MSFKFDITGLIWFVLILAALGGIFALVGPQIMQTMDIPNQLKVQEAKSGVQIAQQKAQADAAPTLTFLETQIKAAELLSVTNASKYAELQAQANISATNAIAASQSEVARIEAATKSQVALNDAERNNNLFKALGYGLMGLSLLGAGGFSTYHILKKRGEHKIEHKRLELQEGELEIKKMQVEVLKKAVDTLAQSGGEMVLDNGHRLVFTPQLQLEAKVGEPICSVAQKQDVQVPVVAQADQPTA